MTNGSEQQAHRKAVAFCIDDPVLPYACYTAWQTACLTPDRDFDILICSLEPLDIPEALQAVGIRNEVMDLQDTFEQVALQGKWLPLTAYQRLWLAEWFADRYDRILYLDMDIEVRSPDLSRLMDVDIGPHALAAVTDVRQWRKPLTPVHDFKERNIKGHKFMNSGFLVIDVAAFNEQKCLERILAFHASGEPTVGHDQSLLNLVLIDDWAELSPVWNWQLHRHYYMLNHVFHPLIFHYTAGAKPWVEERMIKRMTHDVVTRYASFVATHFPDRALKIPQRREMQRSVWWVLLSIWDHLRYAPALFRLMRQFDDDFHAIPHGESTK